MSKTATKAATMSTSSAARSRAGAKKTGAERSAATKAGAKATSGTRAERPRGDSGGAGPDTGSIELLRSLLDELPEDLARQVFTHASWTERRSDSYPRLAFLGDSVLGLAVTAHLYPRLEAERFGEGRLTKIRAQTVSGRSCRAVAERLQVGRRLRAAAPESGEGRHIGMLETERVLASVIEAVIGACYLNAGYERTAEAVVQAFAPEIEHALENPLDFKSALQEQLAQRGETVRYEVVDEHGPPHKRTFVVVARSGEKQIGEGRGRSKKHAEQEAASMALEGLAEG